MAVKVTKKLDGIRRATATFSSFLRQTTDETANSLVQSIRSKMREDTGAEKQSIKVTKTKTLLKQKLTISSDAVQALVDEYGRRAGAKMPPFGRGSLLFEWVGRKIAPDAKNQASITFLVARAISVKGIKANRPFGRTFEENRRGIFRDYANAVEKAISVINR